MHVRSALALLVSVGVLSSYAQQGGVGTTKPLEIRRIVGDGKVTAPEFQLKRGSQTGKLKNWYQITAEYETSAEWTDDVQFTFYVLVKNTKNPKAPPQTVFKQSVTYVDVEKGRQKADVFIHPNTLARFGEVQAVAVQASVQGVMAALETNPETKQRWWEQLAPVEGVLLARHETSFGLIAVDDYPPVKRGSR